MSACSACVSVRLCACGVLSACACLCVVCACVYVFVFVRLYVHMCLSVRIVSLCVIGMFLCVRVCFFVCVFV